MKTVSSHVEDYVKKRPFLSKYLERRIINYRALAKYIRKDIESRVGERISIESIAISLQRLSSQITIDTQPIGILKGVSVISNLNIVVFAQQDATSLVSDSTQAGFFSITIDNAEITIVLDDSAYKNLPAGVHQREKAHTTQVTALEVELIDNTHEQKVGSLVYPTTLLAENGVPICLILSTNTKQFIIIEDQYVEEAVKLLRTSLAR
jgi:hypothetical protein